MASLTSVTSLTNASPSSSAPVDVVIRWYGGPLSLPECRCPNLKRSRCILSSVVKSGGNAVSADTKCREGNPQGVNLDSSKPMFNSSSSGNSMPWGSRKHEGDSEIKKVSTNGESKKVIDLLGDVLQKVEKLEHEKINRAPIPPAKLGFRSWSGRPTSFGGSQKPGIRKSIWRKGDPVPNQPKVPKESSGSSLKVEREKSQHEGTDKVAIESSGVSMAAQTLHSGQTSSQHLQSKIYRGSNNLHNQVASAPPQVFDSKIREVKDDAAGVSKPVARNRPKLQPDPLVNGSMTKSKAHIPSMPTLPPQDHLIAQEKKHTSIFPLPVRLKPHGDLHLEAPKDDRMMAESEAHVPLKPMQSAVPIVDETANMSTAQNPILIDRKIDVEKEANNLHGQVRIVKEENGKLIDSTDVKNPDVSVSVKKSHVAREKRRDKARKQIEKSKEEKEKVRAKVEILEVGEQGMLIEDLAYKLAVTEGELLKLLYSKGVKPDGVHGLDANIVKMICREYDVVVLDVVHANVGEMAKKKDIFAEDDLGKLETRPPVLTIMGHVDHGKTTLLDYIRKTKVASSEAGGITQGIGAYKVLVPVDDEMHPCVFLDTPGHEAFAAMRARGARVTDIAVIVVAADDGIQPQTNEAIAHAKAAGVPIIIAINKIDKDGASPQSVMQELPSVGLTPEDWGGDIPVVQISALNGDNVEELLEIIILVAELQELKANPHREARGTVIEASLNKSKGPMATLIVQNGTLKVGDIIVCGDAFGKVRALFDHDQKRVDQAAPSIPVQVIGLNNVPIAGDEFEVVRSLDVAREMSEARALWLRNERLSAKTVDEKVTLASFAAAVSYGEQSQLDMCQLNIILKVDVQGSIGAIKQALQVLPQDNVTLKFLLQATGDITCSDIDLAFLSKTLVLGFNVRLPGSLKSYAQTKGVEIHLHKIIYDLIDDVRNLMEGLLKPVEEQVPLGKGKVKATFSIGSIRVAGCLISEGKVVHGCGLKVVRKDRTVYVGTLHSLRHLKEEVKEVSSGAECGIGMKDFDDWKVGDIVEAFFKLRKKRTLEEASSTLSAALESLKVS